MKKPFLLALCLALTAPLGLSAAMAQAAGDTAAAAASEHKLHKHHHPAAAVADAQKTPAAATAATDPAANMFKPYPHAGEGDDDGLSRNEDDCNKGCIDE